MQNDHKRSIRSVAIIGSFRQHYEIVSDAWRCFTELGLEVTSPKGTPIIEEGIPFVRFVSDPKKSNDPFVQTVALHRILRAQFVYVVIPAGYVGRTTCYEIGRIVQARQPLYFSESPDDLPICIPDDHIISLRSIAGMLSENRFAPEPLYLNVSLWQLIFERDLLLGRYREDDELHI